MTDRRFARMALLLPQKATARLFQAHAVLFGLGGVGSYAAEALARLGVGRITLVDADVVDESNINRQLPALGSTVGQSKVSVVSARLSDINPQAVIEPIEAFYLPQSPVPIAQSADVVLDAIDTVSAKIDIAEKCAARNLPLISCMGMGNRLD
ncbi:MAG: tRNA threonylcarbamoyladenosine dehydratase, partial [Clostridia bacterium]|nr:tRNA threonylcarbamoyladenosine dehydratase [Clostridia bacterium]